jgi:hypothetical protein
LRGKVFGHYLPVEHEERVLGAHLLLGRHLRLELGHRFLLSLGSGSFLLGHPLFFVPVLAYFTLREPLAWIHGRRQRRGVGRWELLKEVGDERVAERLALHGHKRTAPTGIQNSPKFGAKMGVHGLPVDWGDAIGRTFGPDGVRADENRLMGAIWGTPLEMLLQCWV